MKMNFVIFCKSEKLFVVNMEPKPLTNTELAYKTTLQYSFCWLKPAYCPSAISMKKRGSPRRSKLMNTCVLSQCHLHEEERQPKEK